MLLHQPRLWICGVSSGAFNRMFHNIASIYLHLVHWSKRLFFSVAGGSWQWAQNVGTFWMDSRIEIVSNDDDMVGKISGALMLCVSCSSLQYLARCTTTTGVSSIEWSKARRPLRFLSLEGFWHVPVSGHDARDWWFNNSAVIHPFVASFEQHIILQICWPPEHTDWCPTCVAPILFIKTMSRKQHYTKPVVATIDLHGYKRDEGIAAVTAFVESSQRHQFPPPSTTTDAWICIITGSGHHSPSGRYMYYYIWVSF
jgi:hypothetical protein